MSSEDLPIRTRWDTSYVNRRNRFSFFREGICQAFFNLSPAPRDDGNVRATIEMAAFDKGVLSQIDTLSHRISRTREDSSKIPEDLFSLNLTRSGALTATAAGNAHEMTACQIDAFSVNSIERFDMKESEKHSTFALIFPKSHLRDLKREHPFVVLDKSQSNSALSSCVKLMLERFHGNATKTELSCLINASIALVNASLVGDPDFLVEATRVEATTQGILLALKDHVRRHIDNAELTTRAVARDFGISERYVQKLFADEGLTLRAFVTEERLASVARDLVDPTIAIPIVDIALRWGFRDMTTFHRNFRRRFGDTPKQMRARDDREDRS